MDKLVEKENVWKPQVLGRKIHNRKAGQSVTQLMCKLQNQQNASELDIDTFDGDPLEFHYFMAIFNWKNGRWCMGKAYTFDKIHQGWSQGDGKKPAWSYHLRWGSRLQRDCCMKDMEITQNHSSI